MLLAALGGVFVMAIVVSVPAAPPAVEEYVVVVSPDVPAKNLSVEQLRRLFLFREKYWKPGLPVKIIFSEEGVEPRSFLLEKIYRSDYPSLRRFIVEKLYQEEIDLAPRVVASDDAAVAFVASGSGLITLVRASAAQGAGVKKVAVDGILPGATGYALRK